MGGAPPPALQQALWIWVLFGGLEPPSCLGVPNSAYGYGYDQAYFTPVLMYNVQRDEVACAPGRGWGCAARPLPAGGGARLAVGDPPTGSPLPTPSAAYLDCLGRALLCGLGATGWVPVSKPCLSARNMSNRREWENNSRLRMAPRRPGALPHHQALKNHQGGSEAALPPVDGTERRPQTDWELGGRAGAALAAALDSHQERGRALCPRCVTSGMLYLPLFSGA